MPITTDVRSDGGILVTVDGPFALDEVVEASQTIWLRIYLEPPRFVGTLTDTTLINSYWDDVIVCGASWRGWRYLGEFQRAEAMKQEFAMLIRDAVDFEGLEARGSMAEDPLGKTHRTTS